MNNNIKKRYIVGIVLFILIAYFGISTEVFPVLFSMLYHVVADSASMLVIQTQEYMTLLESMFSSIPNFIDAAFLPEPIPIPDNIARTNNEFAIDFYKQVSNGDENIFFSPASMYVAFSLLYEGARENTADEIQDVFGFEIDDAVRHNSTAHMMASINQVDSHATLDMANALWVANNFAPYDSYLDISRETYLADVEQTSFKSKDGKPGVKLINDWAADNTNDKIKEVLKPKDVGKKTAMVITNAIYFKGTWITQFPVEDTAESTFHITNTDSVLTDFMHVTEQFNYTQSDGIQILKMPYKGDRLSMLVILPEDMDGIDSLEESISSEMIEGWQQNLYSTDVQVKMPKFTMETHYDLPEPLERLGMIDVFNETDARLAGIAPVWPDVDYNLYVSNAFHDVFVDVNEEGTEAAAVTTIIINTYINAPPPPPTFTADHPFIFIIQDDKSGAILFMGKVSDPTVQKQ